MKYPHAMRWLMVLALALVTLPTGAFAGNGIRLLDDRLVIHGKVSEQWVSRVYGLQDWERSSGKVGGYRWSHARTTLKLEVMARLYEGARYELNLYSVWKNYYDAAHLVDSGYRRNVENMGGHRALEDLKSYETFRDICRELYLETNHDLFQLRIGKQIISWGETSVARMTDIVNPTDLRGNLNPAYPDFAEIKRGLWMVRLLFTPQNQPMDMIYEFIVVPDFEPNWNWASGYHLNHSSGAQSLAEPYEILRASYRDAPSNEWKHPEVGFRIRGFVWDFDWTLLYFHHRSDDPVVKTGKVLQSQLMPALGRNAMGLYHALGWDYPLDDVYNYGWQDSIGLTFNKTVDKKIYFIPGTTWSMSGNVLKGEFLAEIGKDHFRQQFQTDPMRMGRRGEHNRYAFALGWDSKIFMPYVTPKLRNKHLSSSTQIFMEWVPSRHSYDVIYPFNVTPPGAQRKKGHHWCMVTQSFDYELWHGRILPGFYWAHAITEGSGYYAPALGFKPTFNWTFLVRYLNYYGYIGDYVNHLDTLTFEITYEF